MNTSSEVFVAIRLNLEKRNPMDRRSFIEKSLLLVAGAPVILPTLQQIHAIKRNKISIRFAIASDGHYGQPETKFEQFHDQMMEWLLVEHKSSRLSFCTFNGDLIHDDPIHFAAVKRQYEKLNIPFYVTRGNHDRCDDETWRATWGMDLNYSFEIEGNAFVALDTSNIEGDYLCPDLEWTARALEKYRQNKNLFVFMHIPPMKWTENGIQCETLLKMFAEQKNLRAIFHGHHHDEDNLKLQGGKMHLFDSHIGGDWGTEYRGYRIVEIFQSGDILTYQVNPSISSHVNTNDVLKNS